MKFSKLAAALDKSQDIGQILIKQLDTGLVGLNADRERKPSGLFNVSDLGYCLRQIYYRHTNPAEFSPNLLRKFVVGVDAGQRVVDILRRSGTLYGCGFCELCGFAATGIRQTCPCSGNSLTYSELGIKDDKLRISGKVDVFAKLGEEIYLVEVKSATTFYKLNKKENIEKFLMRNIHQANMYVGLLRRHSRRVVGGKSLTTVFYDSELGTVVDGVPFYKHVNLDKFILLYEDKNTSEHHAHVFDFDNDMYRSDLRSVKKFFRYLDAGKVPPKGGDLRACKYCDYMKECNADGLEE